MSSIDYQTAQHSDDFTSANRERLRKAKERREARLPTVSYSELATFGQCRQKHAYSYRMNLEAISDPSYKRDFGTVGHLGLEAHYSGSPLPYRVIMNMWMQKQLIDRQLLAEEAVAQIDLTVAAEEVVGNYLKHYRSDGLTVVETEREFTVKLPGIAKRFIGYWDVLVKDANGRLWIMDHKFVFGGQFRKEWELEMDQQLGMYHWAAQELGFDLAGTIYDQIRAEPPREPELLKSGKALSKAGIVTTWDTYRKAIERYGFDVEDYRDMESKLLETKFYERHYLSRTPEQVSQFKSDLLQRAHDMKRKDAAIYMSPSRNNCTSCPFRDLCIERLRGRDLTDYLSTLYRPRSKRQSRSDLLESLEEI